MPTVNAIAQQKALTGDVSSRIFRTNIEAATQSVLVRGPMETANDMIGSNFGLRSNISEMLGNYTQERESFDSEFNRTISSLRESADRLSESVQSNAEEQAAVRDRAQQTERDRQESARRFADEARERLDENEHDRQERAEQLAEITRERMQNSAQAQNDQMERLAEDARERLQQTAQPQAQAQREQPVQTVETARENQQVAQRQRVAAPQTQQTDANVSAEELHERIERDEQSLRGRMEQLADATRQRAQTQRERTEQFARDYLIAEDDERTTQRQVARNLDNTRDENTNAALSNVRNLVDRFNDAVSYFNENRGMSDRMNALAGNFRDNDNFANSLNAVGITVGDNGRLTVNETRLVDALNENSGNVNEVLGRNGLAGRLDGNVELANSQRENLFPTVTDYVNDRRDEPTESLYAAQLNQTAALARQTTSNFVNMFT
ncbi:MAG: hypothetical protein IKD80_06230 [Selenomonadaceae bacterium]|nr:hypothetical protein [Selenomonadaceae bacterium]